MSVIGRICRIIPLGVKLDECTSCRALTAHALARRVRWFHVFSLQLVRLGSDHVLVCGECGHETQVPDDVASKAVREGSIQVDRVRAVVDSAVATRTSAGVGSGLPPISLQRLDPAVVRANWEHRLREVLPVHAQGRQALYDRVWPAIAAVLALAVLGGGGFLAIQATGITAAGPQPSPIAARASTAPTSSPSPKPTPQPTQPPFEVDFNWWKQAYVDHVQPCYTGGACDLEWLIQYTNGTSTPLAAEALRQSKLYRDYDSVQIGSASDCRQEQGRPSRSSRRSPPRSSDPSPEARGGHAEWRPALAVAFEPCSTSSPDLQQARLAAPFSGRCALTLMKVQKLIRAKNSAVLATRPHPLRLWRRRSCAQRRPTSRQPANRHRRRSGGRMGSDAGERDPVERLAGAKWTSSLIDATLESIDRSRCRSPRLEKSIRIDGDFLRTSGVARLAGPKSKAGRRVASASYHRCLGAESVGTSDVGEDVASRHAPIGVVVAASVAAMISFSGPVARSSRPQPTEFPRERSRHISCEWTWR